MEKDRVRWHDEYRHFGTWGEFLEFVHPAPSRGPNAAGILARDPSSRSEGSYHFYGTTTFDEAINLAYNGWLAGQVNAMKLAQPIIERMVSFIERPDIVYDVEGSTLDIGRFCADDPECFIKFENEIVEVPSHPRLLRVVFNIAASCGISKEIMTAKGAAVAALIELLEFAGNRVEVILLPFCGNVTYINEPAEWFNSVLVKAFDQPLELARLIFAIAHPASFRRLGFTLIENGSLDAQSHFRHNYGYPADVSLDTLKEYNLTTDLYFASSAYGQPDWQNQEAVKKWIFETLKAQGVQIKEEVMQPC
jgi:hypothetical protein